MEIRYPTPGRIWSTNDDRTMHWAVRSRLVREWRDTTAIIARMQKVQPQGPSIVTIDLRFSRNGRRDPMNYVGTCLKAAIDGLVDAGVWPDDTPDWVEIRQPNLIIGGPDEVVIRITPMHPELSS
jgi:crossover junction endodeoxyribonuclease RusA